MITDTCQRWTERRESRRPAGETIRTSRYDVARISPTVAAAFVERHHYSGTCSPPANPYGLHDRGELVGVAAFGPPPSMNAHRKVFPTLTTDEAVTLGRFVLVDEVPGNGESWFLARCFELLHQRGIVAVESCSDPEPRASEDGRVVHKGHVGTIYQATNGVYIGKTNPASLRMLPDGTVYSNKSSGKVRTGDVGRGYSEDQLVHWGAVPLMPHDDPQEWLDYWRGRLTTGYRHRGNHRYLWCLDRRRRREVLRFPALPYPKIGGV